MAFHRSMILIAGLLLAACGAATTAAPPTPVVVTQVVPQTVVVTRVATQLATVVVTATPTPAPATPTPLPAGGKWQVDQSSSSFDDSTTVVLLLDAEADIAGPLGATRPTLILRCQEGETEAYVNLGMAPDVEAGNFDGATARYRFDEEPAKTAVLGRSTDDRALFFEDPTAIIATMERHARMVFGFTPFGAPPVETAFDLRGLSSAIVPLRAACP